MVSTCFSASRFNTVSSRFLGSRNDVPVALSSNCVQEAVGKTRHLDQKQRYYKNRVPQYSSVKIITTQFRM